MFEIVAVISGSLVVITVASLSFSRWLIEHEDKMEEEDIPPSQREQCPSLINNGYGRQARCELKHKHFGPHTFDGRWWN